LSLQKLTESHREICTGEEPDRRQNDDRRAPRVSVHGAGSEIPEQCAHGTQQSRPTRGRHTRHRKRSQQGSDQAD
jgi:hypothetical protein